jgi:glucosylceramidase
VTVRLHLCASLLSIATLATLHAQTVHVTQTMDDLSQALATQPTLKFNKAAAGVTASTTITIDITQRFQTIDGFGASMTEGSAYLLGEKLSTAERSKVMTQLFDPKEGVGLSFVRVPIGSTDLSRTHYSYDDMPEGQQDPTMEHFSAAIDEKEVFPIVREALKLNPQITIMATPWSPPAWMKTPESLKAGVLRQDAEPAFASYLVRSIQSMEHAGIPVKYLTIQNEPLNPNKTFPTTLQLADQAKRIIGQDLGPALRKAGLKTEVLAYDHNWDHPEYPLEVLSDPAARPFTAGSAMHCYGGKVEAQDGMHEADPTKGIWMTECSGGNWQKESPLSSTAKLLLGSTQHWSKAVVLWGIALQPDGNPHLGGCGTCRALVTIDTAPATPTITYTGDFYALAQASKFVRPGATRIGSTHSDTLENVAFENTDGTVAVLVYNTATTAQTFEIHASGRSFTSTIPAGALTTYHWTTKK